MKKKAAQKQGFDFSEIIAAPPRYLRAVWDYEISREFQAADKFRVTNDPPFCSLSQDRRREVVEGFDEHHNRRCIEDIRSPHPEWVRLVNDLFERGETTKTVHSICIDWSKGKKTLLNAFEIFLNHRHAKFGGKHKPNRGPEMMPRAWLIDLAIYRLNRAGYSRFDAANVASWILRERGNAFEMSKFEKAISRTKARIQNWKHIPYAEGEIPHCQKMTEAQRRRRFL